MRVSGEGGRDWCCRFLGGIECTEETGGCKFSLPASHAGFSRSWIGRIPVPGKPERQKPQKSSSVVGHNRGDGTCSLETPFRGVIWSYRTKPQAPETFWEHSERFWLFEVVASKVKFKPYKRKKKPQSDASTSSGFLSNKIITVHPQPLCDGSFRHFDASSKFLRQGLCQSFATDHTTGRLGVRLPSVARAYRQVKDFPVFPFFLGLNSHPHQCRPFPAQTGQKLATWPEAHFLAVKRIKQHPQANWMCVCVSVWSRGLWKSFSIRRNAVECEPYVGKCVRQKAVSIAARRNLISFRKIGERNWEICTYALIRFVWDGNVCERSIFFFFVTSSLDRWQAYGENVLTATLCCGKLFFCKSFAVIFRSNICIATRNLEYKLCR